MSTRAPYSSGCHACRRMKVKCDENKPQCGRCTKARRVCPGYRDAKQIIFRSMNAELASKAKASRLAQTQTHRTIAAPDHTRGIVSPSSTPLLLTQPSETWHDRAISYFLHNYSFAPTRDNSGYLGFLPDLLDSNSSAPYLKSAVLAAGSASLANITGFGYLERTAEKQYGETLRSISRVLQDPFEASSDAALTTIVVLQMYEAIAGLTSVTRDPHDKALIELSRLRSRARPGTGNGNALLSTIHFRIHINAVGGLCPSPIETEYDNKAAYFPTPQAELCQLMRETSRCCAEVQTRLLVPGKKFLKSEIIGSLDDLFSAYLCLLDWGASPLSGLSYQSCTIPSRHDHDSQPETFPGKYHLFKDIQHGAIWISFWCTVIYALQVLVYISSHPVLREYFIQGQHSSWQLRKRLYDTVDEICACVPYMLADVDQSGLPTVRRDGKALGCYFLLRGLYVASCVTGLTSVQREYMMKTLLRIAYGKGIKLALRPRNRWLNQHRDGLVQYQ
ncbi:hypothetical protein F5Y07DRAFT_43785 [Xylaria sp. FL0933]|nr:hypothetical protein F5Y07DRAFT_43785 [Xylaria sp. FL0933]